MAVDRRFGRLSGANLSSGDSAAFIRRISVSRQGRGKGHPPKTILKYRAIAVVPSSTVAPLPDYRSKILNFAKEFPTLLSNMS